MISFASASVPSMAESNESGPSEKISELVRANEQYSRLVALQSSPRTRPVNLQSMLRRMHQVVYQPEEFDPVLLFNIPPDRCHWRRQEVSFCRNKVDPQAGRLQPFCSNHITSVQALEYYRAATFLTTKNTAMQAVEALLATASEPDPEPRTPRKKRTRRTPENEGSGDENEDGDGDGGDDDGSGPGTPNRNILARAVERRTGRVASLRELNTGEAHEGEASAPATTTATTE